MSYEYMIPLGILFIAFLIKIPIAFSLICASISYFAMSGMDMGIVCEQMMSALYFRYIIIAVPLFIFTANILNSSKVSDYMFTFCKACIGKRKGALAYVNVLISLIFSGMTGSSFADASGIGKIEIDAMQRDGYDDEFSCAITAATAVIGPVFPPSLNMVTYAMLSGASVGALLMAGMVPGVLIAIVLMLYVGYISGNRNYPAGEKYTLGKLLSYTWKAFPALLTPVILIGGIYTGVVTPTEAGALASIYAIFISLFVYKTLTVTGLWSCIKETAVQTGPILMLICASAPFSYIITLSGLGDTIAASFMNITDNKYVFLLLVNILFLVLGMFLDTSTTTFVVLPIILPIVNALEINLVHFGVIYTLNTMIGMCTPPYGMLCFISAGLVKAPLRGVFREVLPMVLVMLVLLLLITYVPAVSMFIPDMMG